MSTKTAMKLNLKQCLDIKANQYRSKDNQSDYDDVEIDSRIVLLQANKQAKELKRILDELDEEEDFYGTGPDCYTECPPFSQELANEGVYDLYPDDDLQDYYINSNGSLVAIPEQIIPF